MSGLAGIFLIFGIFGGAFGLGFTGAVQPGPMLAATVMHARSRGWVAGVLVSSGHAALELLVIVALFMGAEAALAHPAVVRSVAVAGGALLVAMGLLAALRPPDVAKTGAPVAPGDDAPSERATSSTRAMLVAGVWTSVSNPYFTIWWATAGAFAAFGATGAAGAAGVAGVGAFYVGHVLSDFVWFTFVAAAVGAGRKVFSDRVFRVVLRVCGVALAGFGVFFLVLGIVWPGVLAAAGG